MRQCLREGEDLLDMLDDETYGRCVPAVMNASVGGHYRHTLDHFRSLLEAEHAGVVDYDRRVRGTEIESDRVAAVAETQRLTELLELLPAGWSDRNINVRTLACYGRGASGGTRSTAGREAIFCVMHAVHHYALIRVICGLLGQPLAGNFGVAPSTVAARVTNPPVLAS